MPVQPPNYHLHGRVPDYQRVLIAYSTQGLPIAQIREKLQSADYGPQLYVEFTLSDLEAAAFELQNSRLSVADAIAFLRNQEGLLGEKLFKDVTFEPDHRLSLLQLGAPDDPQYVQGRQWALDRIGTRAAWNCIEACATQPQQVTVAVIDSGVQANHEDLAADFAAGRLSGINVLTELPDNSDHDGHGTMVLGTIAAVSGNGAGVASVARYPLGGAVPPYPYLHTVALKINDVRTAPTAFRAVLGIVWALSRGAQIVNCSWHVLDQRGFLYFLIRFLEQARLSQAANGDPPDFNVLFVIAAGNEGEDNNRRPGVHPASYAGPDRAIDPFSNVISVMASNEHDEKPGFSNYGANVHIAAPGTRIATTGIYYTQPRYPEYSGTSAAAPHVAAAAALLLAGGGNWTPPLLRDHLIASCDYVAALDGLCQANGRLNVHNAVCGPLMSLGPMDAALMAGSVRIGWGLRYKSPVVGTIEIALIQPGLPPQVLVPAVNAAFTAAPTDLTAPEIRSVPLPAGQGLVIRIRCLEMPNFFADSAPFNVLPANAAP